MQGLAIVLAAASLGVDYGWQTTDDGALEYIIQIEPELLSALQKGESIVSEIHPDAVGVRRFRNQVGSQPLPRAGKTPGPQKQAPIDTPEKRAPLTEKPSPPADTPLPDTAAGKTTTPPPGKAFSEDDPLPTFEPLPPNSSDFPLPGDAPNIDNSTSLPSAGLPKPPTDFPIDETDFPVTPAREAPVTLPSPPLPLPADDFTAPQATPVRQKLVPVPDPARQPLDPISSESSFTPSPADTPSPTESNNAAAAIPTFSDAQLATFNKTGKQSVAAPTAPRSTASEPASSANTPETRPWLLLSVTILGLLASLGANAYLAFLFVGIQRRYQGLRMQQRLPGNESS